MIIVFNIIIKWKTTNFSPTTPNLTPRLTAKWFWPLSCSNHQTSFIKISARKKFWNLKENCYWNWKRWKSWRKGSTKPWRRQKSKWKANSNAWLRRGTRWWIMNDCTSWMITELGIVCLPLQIPTRLPLGSSSLLLRWCWGFLRQNRQAFRTSFLKVFYWFFQVIS